eukprot:GHVN01074499.1.p1 GENE.GHVN01074499.1~~GHVN01074499.1.p1  ORF type:complete len:109 (-),score=10.89 GHVN01074499.1:5-331(-)
MNPHKMSCLSFKIPRSVENLRLDCEQLNSDKIGVQLIISGGQYEGVKLTELAAKEEASEKEAASGPSIYDNLSGFFSKANAPIGHGKYEADVAPRMSVEEANARARRT